ncbi:hypothetical protein HK103_004981 [Boothiomyces macroporosus]|uniref:Uncharacterized protein n=1 Tax=Boothiomyces macroporosus TaxID=261099 RepID=A0AAD5UGB6_9FUNG|nr:hypothetical protein HK103_004981 [Boothiomyces macroporosus]
MSKKAYDDFKIKHPDFIWNHGKKGVGKEEKNSSRSKKENEISLTNSTGLSTKSDSQSGSSSPELSSPNSSLSFAKMLDQYPDFDELAESFINEFNPDYKSK